MEHSIPTLDLSKRVPASESRNEGPPEPSTISSFAMALAALENVDALAFEEDIRRNALKPNAPFPFFQENLGHRIDE